MTYHLVNQAETRVMQIMSNDIDSYRQLQMVRHYKQKNINFIDDVSIEKHAQAYTKETNMKFEI